MAHSRAEASGAAAAAREELGWAAVGLAGGLAAVIWEEEGLGAAGWAGLEGVEMAEEVWVVEGAEAAG